MPCWWLTDFRNALLSGALSMKLLRVQSRGSFFYSEEAT